METRLRCRWIPIFDKLFWVFLCKANKLGMTVDRLNDHVKRSTGVTAGHLIRQRVLTEAKRQLVFTTQPIQDIAAELAFADPSHFARFFRKATGITPHEFRDQRGG